MLKVIAEKAVSTTVSLLKKSIVHIAKNASVLWTVETVGEGKVLRFDHKKACTVDAGNDGHSNSHYQAWLYRLPRANGKIDSTELESMLFESVCSNWSAIETVCRNGDVDLPCNFDTDCIEIEYDTVKQFVQNLPEKYDDKAMEKHADRIERELNAILKQAPVTDEQRKALTDEQRKAQTEQESSLLKLSRVSDRDWFSSHWCLLPDDLKKVSVIKQSDFFEIK